MDNDVQLTRDEVQKKRDDFWYSLRVSPSDMIHPSDCDHPNGLHQLIGNTFGPMARGCLTCGWLENWEEV